MHDPVSIAWLILAMPLAAAILAGVMSRTSLRNYANLPLVIACATAAIFSLFLLRELAGAEQKQFLSQSITWFAAGNLKVHYTIDVDPLSAIMLSMITFISTWIALFSTGYMQGDKSYGRFFAVMSLF